MKKEFKELCNEMKIPFILMGILILLLVILTIYDNLRAKAEEEKKKEHEVIKVVEVHDEPVELDIETLFGASEETLRYAKKLDVYGSFMDIGVLGSGYNSLSSAHISYIRTFQDESNYMSCLSCQYSNVQGENYKFNEATRKEGEYSFYSGMLDGIDVYKMIKDDYMSSVLSPDIEIILFPEPTKYEYAYFTDGKGDEKKQYYVVRLAGNMDDMSLALSNTIGEKIHVYSAEYYFNSATHVLEKVSINNRMFGINFKVVSYDYETHELIKIPEE